VKWLARRHPLLGGAICWYGASSCTSSMAPQHLWQKSATPPSQTFLGWCLWQKPGSLCRSESSDCDFLLRPVPSISRQRMSAKSKQQGTLVLRKSLPLPLSQALHGLVSLTKAMQSLPIQLFNLQFSVRHPPKYKTAKDKCQIEVYCMYVGIPSLRGYKQHFLDSEWHALIK
jgi:hypothetical protein